jgi:heat-inducible transcriptional repressor
MLIERDQDILRAIIEVYVSDGVPVSSGRVREAGCLPISTASIRNRMVVLEREGYLSKAHVSSGRVPTDDGYRFYVDHLQADCAWLEADGLPEVRGGLRTDAHDMSAMMMQVLQMLGALSRNVAVVYGAILQESRVRSVKLFRVEGDRMIVAVNLVPEHERNVTLRLGRSVAQEAVAGAEGLVNRMLAGRTLEEAREALSEAVRDNVTDEGVLIREIAARRDEVFSEPPAVELCFEERSRVLEQPELSDPRTLQLLLRILHNRDYLTSILASRPLDRTEVTIGREHGDEALRPFSLVTAGYRVGAARGVLGIIGPTRMRYDVALSLVGAMSRELRAIGDEYF